MSSDLPSEDPLPEPSSPAGTELDPDLIEELGARLLEGLDARLPGAREHADATASWALAIAVELGLQRRRCLSIREVARLHEIGMLYVRHDLLVRPLAELTAEEAAEVERHATAGADLAAGAGLPEACCTWLRHQRERFGGGGLPDGLAGEEIPLESRIIRTACTFDTPPTATDLASLAGTELDPAAVDALEIAIGRAGEK
jgi:HD-GYP domain-containing protein (c-di-GMP phosphodiesterase class II)